MNYLRNSIILLLILIANSCISQNGNNTYSLDDKNNWFISSGYGIQISGIKSEDFIGSNVSPAFSLNIGKWVSNEIALQIAYKGFYFHTISDKKKHYFSFFFGEILLDLNELINGAKISKNKWKIIFHPGAGYFYNKYYKRPNVCANIGITNSLRLTDQLDIFIDVSAIIGWDIYQGDEDILPSCVLGLTYSF